MNKLFNQSGRLVKVLVNGRGETGNYRTALDASGLPSGSYLLRLQTADRMSVQTLQVIK